MHLNRATLVNKGFLIRKKETISYGTLALEEGSFRICGENVTNFHMIISII